MISLTSYSQIVMQLLSAPGRFFECSQKQFRARHAAGFLLISTVLFTAAALAMLRTEKLLIDGTVLAANAFGMVLVMSAVGYIVMGASVGRKTSFGDFFSVYAYASGTTLLAAWIPSTMLFTEPWRWILIGIGLRRACGLGIGATIWVILCSIAIVSSLLYALM